MKKHESFYLKGFQMKTEERIRKMEADILFWKGAIMRMEINLEHLKHEFEYEKKRDKKDGE